MPRFVEIGKIASLCAKQETDVFSKHAPFLSQFLMEFSGIYRICRILFLVNFKMKITQHNILQIL